MASIKRIDHVAIAVRDADQACAQYVALLNAVHIRTETLIEKAGPVKVAYLQIGENVLSLVQSLEPGGFIEKHIEKHGEGLHHMGLEVDDLDEFVREVEADDTGALARHGLGEQSPAAADIHDRESCKRTAPFDVPKTNRVEVVQRAHRTVGVPPAARRRLEAGELGRIDIQLLSHRRRSPRPHSRRAACATLPHAPESRIRPSE